MFEIPGINSTTVQYTRQNNSLQNNKKADNNYATVPSELTKVSANNLRAYIPSFTAKANKNTEVTKQTQIKAIKAQLDDEGKILFKNLQAAGILENNDSNDGSSVMDNLYKIATEPRFTGLSSEQIIKDVLKALANPYSITQQFGDIPDEVIAEYEQKAGKAFPENAKNVISSACVVASMEFNLAHSKPAEFARFAACLSGQDYMVSKTSKIENIADGSLTNALWKLRKFNTDSQIHSNWEDFTINIRPDRNAIVRARVQSSYKDPGERSVVDVLIQSALLNLGSQNTYNAITDERFGELNTDSTGLNEIEKSFVEEVVFEAGKFSVVYQNIDENGRLAGRNGELTETKQHILNSLNLGQNVIIGYTHFNADNQVDGGHEITIIGYQTDENGNGYFICNDTDDQKDEPITISEKELLPLIHHAGIPKEALNPEDEYQESWREILNLVKEEFKIK
ncbi:MAG: hypothetical protein ACI37R_03280 [Candidatus Avigastranaerophilus sp.]